MNAALLVIDVQNIYTNKESELYCEGSKTTVSNINKLIDKFESSGYPIFLVRHIHKADGSDLGRMFDYLGDSNEEFDFVQGTKEVEYDSTLTIPKSHIEIIKNRYSAFVGTSLLHKLKQFSIERIVVCGFMTNFCCESTARHAHDLDFFVDFIIDATGTPGTESLDQDQIRRDVTEVMEAGIARVHTTEDCLDLTYDQ